MKLKIPFILFLAVILYLTIFKMKEGYMMTQIFDWRGHTGLRNDSKENSTQVYPLKYNKKGAYWYPIISGADCIETCLNADWCRLASYRTTGECELNDNNTGVNTYDDAWKTWVKLPDS